MRYTDKDLELFKLQAAAQHYESNLQMGYNGLGAFVLAVLILALGAVLYKQLSLFAGVLMWVVGFLVGALLLWRHIREYNRAIEGLDQHLKNLVNGQPAPSLKDLTKD